MSQLFIESFDSETTIANINARFTSGNGDLLYSSKGRTGSVGYGMTNTELARKDVSAGIATIITGVGIAVYQNPSAYTALGKVLQILDGATIQLYVRLNADQTFSVYNGANTLLAGPSTHVIDDRSIGASNYSYLDLKATIHNTAGSFTLNIYTTGGNETLSASGVNTRGSSNNQATGVGLGGSGNGQTLVYDDWYIADTTGSAPQNDLWGPVKIYCDFPSGAGTTTQFTPSTGSNYQNVDETNQNGDTDYNADGTAGHIDTFAMPTPTPTVGTVLAEQVTVWAKRDDATTRTFCVERRSGGTNYAGAETFTPTASYLPYISIQQTDPAAGAWSISSLTSEEVGYKVLS